MNIPFEEKRDLLQLFFAEKSFLIQNKCYAGGKDYRSINNGLLTELLSAVIFNTYQPG